MSATWVRAIGFKSIIKSFWPFILMAVPVFAAIWIIEEYFPVVGNIFGSAGVIPAAGFVYLLVRDAFSVYNILRPMSSPRDIDDVLAKLDRIHFDRFRSSCLKIFRERAMFPPSSTTEKKVADLATAVERTGKYGPDVLDELCRLRESLRTEPIAATLPPERITEAS